MQPDPGVGRFAGRPSPGALLVFDFDGTLWRGDDPLDCYAELVSLGLDPAERAPFLADVHAFLSGDHWSVSGLEPPPDDGWAAIAAFAAARGESAAHRQAAFLETRRRIAAGEFPLEVPGGLREFLAASRDSCAVVLASNSPGASVHPVLDRLGLTPFFDDVASDAGKPDRLPEVVDSWITVYRPAHVMSIGDHYRNDIAPAVRRGWFTTYISPWRWVPGPCSVVGATMEDVLPGLYAWVRAVRGAVEQQEPGVGEAVRSRQAAIPAPTWGRDPGKEVDRTA